MHKTILLLGGTSCLIPVIEEAHNLGLHVVTMDNVPGNAAHLYSDEYRNVSVIDKEAVLRAARDMRIDGISSFACDAGAISAAYTAEQMKLPYQGPYESVLTLQDKHRFRSFLESHGFNCPKTLTLDSTGDLKNIADSLPYPVMVKPVDSAGSKGCSRVDGPSSLESAVESALGFSFQGKCIIEQFITPISPPSDSDSFVIGGRLSCVSFTSQYFDNSAINPYAPASFAMPESMPKSAAIQIAVDLQRLVDLLGLQTGAFNVESRVGADGLPYIMECSPRAGGNRLSEMLRYASGVDLVKASVLSALGDMPNEVNMPVYSGYWYQEILHSGKDGVFRGIQYEGDFKRLHVVDEQIWLEAGSRVENFSGGNKSFGSVIMRFNSQSELDEFHQNKTEFMRVAVD